MRKIERLRKEALESCKFKGHKMRPFSRYFRRWWNSRCKNCGMGVFIDDEPALNGTSINGEAVTLRCTG